MSQRPANSSLLLTPFASSPRFLCPPPLHSLGKAEDLSALEAAGMEEGSLIRGSSTQEPGDSRAASLIDVKMASKEGLVGGRQCTHWVHMVGQSPEDTGHAGFKQGSGL